MSTTVVADSPITPLQIPNNMYSMHNFVFEIEKNCGEKQYVLMNKDATLADLHIKTKKTFGTNVDSKKQMNSFGITHEEIYDDIPDRSSTQIYDIFISNESYPSVKSIPNNEYITVFDFVHENSEIMNSVPTKTTQPVYKLYVIDELYVDELIQKRKQLREKLSKQTPSVIANIRAQLHTQLRAIIIDCFGNIYDCLCDNKKHPKNL